MSDLIVAGEFISRSRTEKAQATVDAYTDWVLNQLVGTYGTDRAHVVGRIISEWMKENREYLREIGIEPPRIQAARAVISQGGESK